MASEDSDEVVPGLLSVHGLSYLRDLDQSGRREMPAAIYELHALRELLEVALLRRDHRVVGKERDDHFKKVVPPVDDELSQVLAVVVGPLVDEDAPDPEEAQKLLQAGDTLHTLRDHEPVKDLVAGLVASAIRSVWLPNESDGEASLSVYKADDPATELDQPFLLVFRTRHVVTMVNVVSDVTR